MAVYDKAIELYKHQHDRWNHWALFFFGLMASVFVTHHYSNHAIPLKAAYLFAALISAAWVCAALSIRASTYSWLQVIHRLETLSEADQTGFRLFHEFEIEQGRRDRMADLIQTMKFWTKEPYLRVTRLIMLIGVGLVVGFLTLAVFS